MHVQDLRQLLETVPGNYVVGIRVTGDPQGHEVFPGEGPNHREEIYWLTTREDHSDTVITVNREDLRRTIEHLDSFGDGQGCQASFVDRLRKVLET